MDTCLPFGLRYVLIIFTTMADALEWIVKACGVRIMCNYSDDLITVGASATGECQANIKCLSHTCKQLGVTLALHKCEGPSTCLKFLGIEIDSVAVELRLPADKLERVQKTVQEWLEKDSGRKRDVE